MTAASPSGAVAQPLPSGRPAIVGQIRAARARATLRFRLLSVATWMAIVAVLAVGVGRQFDVEFVATWAPFILGGVQTTVVVSVASIAFAVVFALVGAFGRLTTIAPIHATATLYISLVRGTPLVVQILFLYLALPQVFPAAAQIPLIALGIFALAFNYGAYMTEIFRAGIEAVPRGQREAAQALGMPERLIMRRIVLPQATRIVIPAIGNEFIAMIKDSALVSLIAVQELLWRAQTAGSQSFRAFETLTFAAVIYWGLTIVLSLFQDRLEKRMARGDR